MDDNQFTTDLVRLVVAELYVSLEMQMARALLEKSYLALSLDEKIVVDQTIHLHVSTVFRNLTPALLAGLGTVPQTVPATAAGSSHPIGFQSAAPPKGS